MTVLGWGRGWPAIAEQVAEFSGLALARSHPQWGSGEPGHQAGLGVTVGIEDDLVVPGAQAALEASQFSPGLHPPKWILEQPSQLLNRDRDHSVQVRVTLYQRDQFVLGGKVNLRPRVGVA
jgi:hypothetical protein